MIRSTNPSLDGKTGGADVVIFLELLPSGDGLQVTAMAGASEHP